MANKVFSIYKTGKERSAKNNDRLTVEIGNTHVACMVVGGSSNQIEDFEFFELPTSGFKNFEEDFAYTIIGSRLLDKPYADKKVFINIEESVLVPAHLYSVEKSENYLNLVYGNTYNGEVLKDDLNNQFQIINTFRVPVHLKEVVEKNLAVVTLAHTYSNILGNLFWKLSSLPNKLIQVQFYRNYFIAAVLIEHRVQFIQSFSFTSPEDVLYNLLNIYQQFNLPGALLQLSGIIDLKSSVYESISTYFKNISIEDSNVPDMDMSDYSPHYFTPFFKLAQ